MIFFGRVGFQFPAVNKEAINVQNSETNPFILFLFKLLDVHHKHFMAYQLPSWQRFCAIVSHVAMANIHQDCMFQEKSMFQESQEKCCQELHDSNKKADLLNMNKNLETSKNLHKQENQIIIQGIRKRSKITGNFKLTAVDK